MKKTLIIALAAFTFFACKQEATYTIIGTIAEEGKFVVLQKSIDGEWVADTAEIIDGKYTFTGSIEEPTFARLQLHAEWARLLASFVLENGTIKITTDADRRNTITGTKNNNIRQTFLDAEFDHNKKMHEIFRSNHEAREIGNIELADSLQEKGREYWDKWFDLVTEFVSRNINNPAGQIQLRETQSRLELESLQKIIANANRKTLQIPAIVRIVERIEALERTAIGQPFTDLRMPDPNGNYIAISDFVGKGYLLIDFTATWCGPCIFGKPKMIETFNRFKDRGFNIIGVWFDNSHEAWINGMARLNMPDWPQMSDLKGWDSEGTRLYAISFVPSSVLIDPNGIIIAKNLGDEELNKKLEELLGQ